jgi:hypothetical protein
VVRPLVPNRSLVLFLCLDHFSMALDLRKCMLFHSGVYELMTERFSRIKPGHTGLGLHRFALRESDDNFVAYRQRLSVDSDDGCV